MAANINRCCERGDVVYAILCQLKYGIKKTTPTFNVKTLELIHISCQMSESKFFRSFQSPGTIYESIKIKLNTFTKAKTRYELIKNLEVVHATCRLLLYY
jgi:hypothetical protein